MKLKMETIIVVVLTLLLICAGWVFAGTITFVDESQGGYYEVPAANVPATAAGNIPSDNGYCFVGYFNESATRVWRTGTANITAIVQHGWKEPTSGTIGWQNATDSFFINGAGALVNSTLMQTAKDERGQCWRLSITAGATLTNAISNVAVVVKENH